jgi:hypothetical protein
MTAIEVISAFDLATKVRPPHPSVSVSVQTHLTSCSPLLLLCCFQTQSGERETQRPVIYQWNYEPILEIRKAFLATNSPTSGTKRPRSDSTALSDPMAAPLAQDDEGNMFRLKKFLKYVPLVAGHCCCV